MNDAVKRRLSRLGRRPRAGAKVPDFRTDPNVFIVSVSSLIKMQIRHAQSARPRRRTVVRVVLSYILTIL